MKSKLQVLGLNPSNSVVIGSGILQALEIRKSNDIDLVVTQDIYDHLEETGKFNISISNGREILKDDIFEIGTSWNVLGRPNAFEDFVDNSTIIEGVRYITLDFLYKAKQSWVDEKTARPKDINDIKLIEEYKKVHAS